MTDPTLTIENVRAEGSTIRATIDYPRTLGRFFADDEFVFEYDDSVEDVPEHVLVIPVLAQVCPVAWTRGVSVHTYTVDLTFLESLVRVGNTLVDMHPEFMAGGSVSCAKPVEEPPGQSSGDCALLFSGGVDSMTSYVRHREADPTLISVHGWQAATDERHRWDRIAEHITEFAEARDCEQAVISSNMLDVLDTPMLNAHFKRYFDGSWYSSVGHGLGLLGLCAPIAYRDGIDEVYIAATHTEDFDEPWGSHPAIDDQIEWTGTTCTHDGYELSRQEKLDRIAEYSDSTGESFPIRACTRDEAGGNCLECEKCNRTAIELWLAGLEPAEFGFEMPSDVFERIRAGLEHDDWLIGEHQLFMWEDIQRHADRIDGYADARQMDTRMADPADAAEFFTWLRRADLAQLAEQSGPPVSDRLVRTVARSVPSSVYAAFYSVYTAVK